MEEGNCNILARFGSGSFSYFPFSHYEFYETVWCSGYSVRLRSWKIPFESHTLSWKTTGWAWATTLFASTTSHLPSSCPAHWLRSVRSCSLSLPLARRWVATTDREFSMVVPHLWNAVSFEAFLTPILFSCRCQAKTYLFTQTFKYEVLSFFSCFMVYPKAEDSFINNIVDRSVCFMLLLCPALFLVTCLYFDLLY